jgi:hypothetical protein
MAAAQQTTAPIIIAAGAPTLEFSPRSNRRRRDENRIVAIVTPEIGLLDEPTIPAMYAATAEKRNPKIIMTMVKREAIATLFTISK